MPAPIVVKLITEDLGYCCPYSFFRLYRSTRVIAARLGIHPRTVRKYKERFKEKELQCEKCERCLLPVLRRNLK